MQSTTRSWPDIFACILYYPLCLATDRWLTLTFFGMHSAPPGTVIRCVSGGLQVLQVHRVPLTQLWMSITRCWLFSFHCESWFWFLISYQYFQLSSMYFFFNKGYHLLKPKRLTARMIGDRAGTECKCLNICFCLSLDKALQWWVELIIRCHPRDCFLIEYGFPSNMGFRGVNQAL